MSVFSDKEAGQPVLDAEIGDAVRLTQGGAVVSERVQGMLKKIKKIIKQ